MDSQHIGSLTHPPNLLAELEQIGGMETGRKYFSSNEVTTDLNGELRFRNFPDRDRAEPLTLELNQKRDALGATLGFPIHGTETLQGFNFREGSPDTQSLETKPQATYPAPKTTALLVPDMEVEKDKGEEKGELNTRLTCLQDTHCSGFRVDQRPSKQHLCTGEKKEGPPAEPEPTDYAAAIKKDNGTKLSHTNQETFQGHQMDIHLCTPKGEKVLWQDVKWERNPYAEAYQDSSDLLGIVPGHYHLQAYHTAEVLVQTNLHSQFYKSGPALETKVPGYSLGRDRVAKNQARSATRLQVLEAKKKKANAAVSSSGPTPTLRSTQSPKQGKSTEEDEVDEDETTYDPVDKRTEVPPTVAFSTRIETPNPSLQGGC